MEKFIALFDLHYGYERRGGHKVPVHDQKALDVALQFAEDFKPDHTILGGDMLDCSAISHHTKGKPGLTEGFRLLGDAAELGNLLIKPAQSFTKNRLVYHYGNHEDWLLDLVNEVPALEGLIEPENLLKLNKRWEIIPTGGTSKLGKLTFLHGDTVKGGQHCAQAAVTNYERNVRFGHFHTYQVATKTTPVDANGHTGVAVPCLCKNGPKYGGGAPNKWMQGFSWGYVNCPDSTFNDYVTVIVNGKATINGKTYKG